MLVAIEEVGPWGNGRKIRVAQHVEVEVTTRGFHTIGRVVGDGVHDTVIIAGFRVGADCLVWGATPVAAT